jgi:5'(3')-deoxyribonucleotidase
MRQQVDKKIVGFDMDGVIIDHVRNKIRLAGLFGVKLTPAQTPSEIIKNTMPEPQYRELQYLLYDHPEIGPSAPMMPGVKLVLEKLQKQGVPYFLISRRKRAGTAVKLLSRHGLWPKYFNKKNTYFVKEVEDKEVKAKALGITHYIDDEQKVLKALNSVKNKFLFDYIGVFKDTPYNRITSWREISRLI